MILNIKFLKSRHDYKKMIKILYVLYLAPVLLMLLSFIGFFLGILFRAGWTDFFLYLINTDSVFNYYKYYFYINFTILSIIFIVLFLFGIFTQKKKNSELEFSSLIIKTTIFPVVISIGVFLFTLFL